MSNNSFLTEEDRNFITNMKLGIDSEMDDEFKDEMLLDIETGTMYLEDARRNGDLRSAVEIWDEWERQRLEEEDLENII